MIPPRRPSRKGSQLGAGGFLVVWLAASAYASFASIWTTVKTTTTSNTGGCLTRRRAAVYRVKRACQRRGLLHVLPQMATEKRIELVAEPFQIADIGRFAPSDFHLLSQPIIRLRLSGHQRATEGRKTPRPESGRNASAAGDSTVIVEATFETGHWTSLISRQNMPA